VRDACREPWPFVRTGKYQLKGQSQEQPIYSLEDPIVNDIRTYQQILADLEGFCRESHTS